MQFLQKFWALQSPLKERRACLKVRTCDAKVGFPCKTGGFAHMACCFLRSMFLYRGLNNTSKRDVDVMTERAGSKQVHTVAFHSKRDFKFRSPFPTRSPELPTAERMGSCCQQRGRPDHWTDKEASHQAHCGRPGALDELELSSHKNATITIIHSLQMGLTRRAL
jgi:hypothetical protein